MKSTDKTADERIHEALLLASDILDNHTANTDADKAYRNCTRLFLFILSDEKADMEK